MMSTLADRTDIQDKLRAEILEAQAQFGEDIPYDDLVALPYMDAFIRESLRLQVLFHVLDWYAAYLNPSSRHAPASFITREYVNSLTSTTLTNIIMAY